MPDLTAAHRGYEYQDLMAACELVDVVLGSVSEVLVDKKLFVSDRFDDLTSVGAVGDRKRVQFKHTDNDDRPLTLSTFTRDDRDLRLDKLVAAASADRALTGGGVTSFRIVMRDLRPTDSRLTAVLRPGSADPGPFQPGMNTFRMRFSADALWKVAGDASNRGQSAFEFLRDGATAVSFEDLQWLCDRLTVEVEAPRASWDLTDPGPAEHLLLGRLRSDVGADTYPNQDRAAVDVADAFVRMARVARQGSTTITRDELLRRAHLRHDYGAVARAHPVDPFVEVSRPDAVAALREAARAAASTGGTLVLTAPPGHGKSWLCQQLTTGLAADGWLVAEHFCYLGDADNERLARVLAESLFGSLLARVADADPTAVTDLRPLLAANEDAVVAAVQRARQRRPERPVALVVDGLDHVTRVRQGAYGFDPSFVIAESLAALELPPGSVLILLSQPGGHLEPLTQAGASQIAVAGMSKPELASLATNLGIGEDQGLSDTKKAAVVEALEERSDGNALYATYLCREALRQPVRPLAPAATIRALPSFDGTLGNYYKHLWDSLERDSWWVAEVVALIDFAVTPEELKEIRPAAARRVGAAIKVLAPVLVDRPSQGGLRIYHESFGRYLRQQLRDDPQALEADLISIAGWLTGKGLFRDPRAFRSLLPILAQAGHHDEVVALVDKSFVADAAAAAFPVSAIRAVLSVAVTSAAAVDDWPAVARCVELSRAAATLQDERFDSTLVAFADVIGTLLGPSTLGDRLLHDGRTVMPARAGLQMCAAVDRLGGIPPWREYLIAHRVEAPEDNTSYGNDSDRAVDLAWLRGRLRLAAAAAAPAPGERTAPSTPSATDDDLSAPVDWDRVAEFYNGGHWSSRGLIDALVDTFGTAAAEAFVLLLDDAGPYCLAMADAVAGGNLKDSTCSARTWAWAAMAHGAPSGWISRLVGTGLAPEDLATFVSPTRDQLLALTHRVQAPSVRWEDDLLPAWLDQVLAAAIADPIGLNTAEALISGPGWYRCWLRFVIALARAEVAPEDSRAPMAEEALGLLTGDLNPFTGEPRACDLYSIHGTIQAYVARALAVIRDENSWTRSTALIIRVSDALSVTFSGELGGPLPADWVQRLIAATAPPTRLREVRDLAISEMSDSAAGRYYSDIADATLRAARAELALGDTAAAAALWGQASHLLAAYGWHKDMTVFELLDPFHMLIEQDPPQARKRLPMLQALVERVCLHTDGDETRHAHARFWELLAQADPVALAELIAPAVHAATNEPGHHLHDGLAQLWHAWNLTADPFVVGSLRLTLRSPIDPADPAALSRLCESYTDDKEPGHLLLKSCLGRFDERPASYPYTNGEAAVAADSRVVDTINQCAQTRIAEAHVWEFPDVARPRAHSDERPPRAGQPLTASQRIAALSPQVFPDGAVGLARAIRAWQARGYDDTTGTWAVDRAANILGYRLLALASDGRREEALLMLGSVADGVDFGRGCEVLAALADGFAERGEHALAAAAGALAWTRARGHGGWLAFGGTTELETLRRASYEDRELALRTVADEIARLVRRPDGRTWGITQALVIAAASGAFGAGTVTANGLAFATFDAALEVITARAPHVHPTDDPELPYAVPALDDGTACPGVLDVALATAAIAGISRPEREAKRRAFLATTFLVQHRPEVAADGVRIALRYQSDTATLTWLLEVLRQHAPADSPALALSADELRLLADRPQLTVRATARELSPTVPPLSPLQPADPELLPHSALWVPTTRGAHAAEDTDLHGLVRELAGQRLDAAEQLLPGISAAVDRRTAEALSDEALHARRAEQLRALGDSSAGAARIPDAYLAIDEVVEEALQLAAAGIRAARLAAGNADDPRLSEAQLARRVIDDPRLALDIERCRLPRPHLPGPPGRDAEAWNVPPSAEGIGGAIHSRTEPEHLAGLLAGQVIEGFDQLDVAGGEWRVLASAEVLVDSPPYMDKRPDVIVHRLRAVEIREENDGSGLELPPFAVGDIGAWVVPPALLDSARATAPIVGLDQSVGVATDSRHGLGLIVPLVAPTPWLLAVLHPTSQPSRFELNDDHGPLVALRTWRTLYEVSDYHQPWPRLTGCAMMITRRGFGRLLSSGARLNRRDYVERYNR